MVDVVVPKRYIHIEQDQMKDPFFLATALKNKRIPHEQKAELFPAYLDLLLTSTLQYDQRNFPPSDKIYRGTPPYLPDQYHYMGPDPEVDPKKRRGEMIIIDKRKILGGSHHLFWQIFHEGEISTRRKVEIIADDIDWTIFSERANGETSCSGVVGLHDYIGISKTAQCRHLALYAQIMFQTMGIESQYVPADIICEDTGQTAGHACNLVRIDNGWFLLSANRPSRLRTSDVPASNRILLSPIPEQEIEINKRTYTWRPDFWTDTLIRSRQRAFFQIK